LLHSRKHGLINVWVCRNYNLIINSDAVFSHYAIRLFYYHSRILNRLIDNYIVGWCEVVCCIIWSSCRWYATCMDVGVWDVLIMLSLMITYKWISSFN
jgi:hypothetical protein